MLWIVCRGGHVIVWDLAPSTMAGDSQTTFSKSVKKKIHDTFDYRCVICLNFVQTSQCAHIIDAATALKQQVCNEIVM
jgi:predicted restriction endonuclease